MAYHDIVACGETSQTHPLSSILSGFEIKYIEDGFSFVTVLYFADRQLFQEPCEF